MVALFEILGVAFILSFIPIAFLFVSAQRRTRRPRLVACPETQTPELVSLDATGTARSALFADGEVVLASCTGWPERALCARGCLEGIESVATESRLGEQLAANRARTAEDLMGGPDSLRDRPAFPLRDGKSSGELGVAR